MAAIRHRALTHPFPRLPECRFQECPEYHQEQLFLDTPYRESHQHLRQLKEDNALAMPKTIVRLDLRERLDHRDTTDWMVLMVSMELTVGMPRPSDSLSPTSVASLVQLEHPERREPRASPAFEACAEAADSPETPAAMDNQGRRERWARLDRRVPMERLALRELKGTTPNSLSPGRAIVDPSDQLDLRERRETMDSLEHPESRDLKEHRERPDTKELLDRMEMKDQKEELEDPVKTRSTVRVLLVMELEDTMEAAVAVEEAAKEEKAKAIARALLISDSSSYYSYCPSANRITRHSSGNIATAPNNWTNTRIIWIVTYIYRHSRHRLVAYHRDHRWFGRHGTDLNGRNGDADNNRRQSNLISLLSRSFLNSPLPSLG